MKISVVVCIKNEEERIEECLKSILENNPDEIIVVDGNSSDNTVEICRKYTDNIIITQNSNLTTDRQTGINAAKNKYIAMIDADHRLEKDDLKNLLQDLIDFNFDIVQSQLCSFKNHNWLNKAEDQMWELNHNIAGPKKMIGVAPAIYKKELFERINFDDTITKTIEDTDFIYRLSLLENVRYGIGNTKIAQLHNSSLADYIKKFRWYGKGDGEFCIKNKNRAFSMFFHLFVRYPLIYNIKAVMKCKFYAIPYQILQGYIRGKSMIRTIIGHKK